MTKAIIKNKYKIILGCILSAVFILHIPGLFYGFPLKNAIGDEVTTMSAIFKMMNDQSLRPNYSSFYHLPVTAYAQLPFYFLLIIFLKFSGLFADWESLKTFVILDYGYFLPYARLLTAGFAVMAVWMMYLLTDKIFKNKHIALLSSFLLAFNLMFFQVTQFARAWSLQILLLLIAVYFYYDFFERGKNKLWDYFVISFVTALALGVHLASSLVYVIFLIFYFQKNSLKKFFYFGSSWLRQHKHFVYLNIFIVLWLGLFYYLNPTGFLIYLQQPAIEKNFGFANLISNTWFYTKVFFSYDVLVAVCAIPGFILLYKNYKHIFFAFSGFIILFVSSIAYAIHAEPRFIIATMPFFVMPAGYFLVWLINKLNFKWQKSLAYLLIIIWTMYLPWLWCAKVTKPNTMILTRQWILGNIAAGAGILSSDPYLDIPENQASAQFSLALNSNANTIERRFIAASQDGLLTQPRYFVLTLQGLGGAQDYFGDALQDVEYIVISFWNSQERARLLENIKNFDTSLETKYYPTRPAEDITNMAGNMLNPRSLLPSLNKTGPFVEIYKVNLKK